MSSGSAGEGADGTSNSNDAFTTVQGVSGDANLNALIPGFTTYDAVVLGK
jgi:hypothetical protein